MWTCPGLQVSSGRRGHWSVPVEADPDGSSSGDEDMQDDGDPDGGGAQ